MAKTILSVDDEVETREFVSAVLDENGYTSILAKNGEEALDIIKQTRPDLVIMDILMPRQSGIRLYRELRLSETYRDIPVIIYSGIPRRTLLRAQAALSESEGESVPDPEAYIEKPVSPKKLADTVRNILK